MANKFQVSGQVLTITDTVTNKTLVKSPKADLFYYIEALESTIPSIKLYDISGANSSGGATTFSCLLSTAIDSSDVPFTVETFKTFADSNLGFKAASLETDPIFGASEASLFVSGDKAKLDTVTNKWGLQGNAGTNPATNFIGTTDNQNLVIRTNNIPQLQLQPDGGNEIFAPAIQGGNPAFTNVALLITNANNRYRVNIGSNGTINVTSRYGSSMTTDIQGGGANPFGGPSDAAGDYSIRTTPSLLTRLIVKNNGLIGIGGITTPTKTLDINGELRVRTRPAGATTDTIITANGSGDVRELAISTLQSGTAGQVAFFNGTNVQGGSNNLFWDNTNGRLGIGTTTPSYALDVRNGSVYAHNGSFLLSSWGDTAASQFIGKVSIGGILIGGMEIENTTLGGSYSQKLHFNTHYFGVSATKRMTIAENGNVGIGTTTPTATLHLKAGTATANTAPIKLTAGTNMTTPENGAFEFDGTNLYFTVGGVRKTVTLV